MTNFYCGRRETAVDWEVKIADFVVVLGDKIGESPANGHITRNTTNNNFTYYWIDRDDGNTIKSFTFTHE